jgi:hypothetical protein
VDRLVEHLQSAQSIDELVAQRDRALLPALAASDMVEKN